MSNPLFSLMVSEVFFDYLTLTFNPQHEKLITYIN